MKQREEKMTGKIREQTLTDLWYNIKYFNI